MLKLKMIIVLVLGLCVSCSGKKTEKPKMIKVNNSTNNNHTNNNKPTNNRSNNNTTQTTFTIADTGWDKPFKNPNCLAKDRPPAKTSVALEPAFPSLSFQFPLFARQAPGDDSKWYVVEKAGRIQMFENKYTTTKKEVFVDISDKIVANGEKGLLGFAFHPKWKTNNQVFLSYTLPPSSKPISIVSKFTIVGGRIDTSTEVELIRLVQPYSNHNGGDIEFGPDGFLYVGFGDGGSGGDPHKNGQNVNTLLGSILRIDVDKKEGGKNYAIPTDNPFAQSGGAPEIYAWGIRNPWRFSFDIDSGKLWVGDVGQNKFEEVSIVERGGNYGWSKKEGFACFDATPPCDKLPFIDPILDYPRSDGQSITGGYVYRGKEIPNLVGKYIFGDFVSQEIWTLIFDPNTGKATKRSLLNAGFRIASFAQDNQGEVFVLDFSNGKMLKLKKASNDTPSTFPKLLSETGCMDPSDIKKPGAGLYPYEVNAPFWSDGAEKERFFAIPDHKKISVNSEGRFIFPKGSVLVKNFRIDKKLVETRLLMLHDDGDWGGYLYEWNDDESEAFLLEGEKTKVLSNGQRWIFPSRSECMICHTSAASRVLGTEIAQLNKEMNYRSTGRRSNQLRTLKSIGVLDDSVGEINTLARLVDPFGNADLDKRARSYLHTNCASCHLEGNDLRVDFDFSYTSNLNSFCEQDVLKPFTLSNPKVISPGDVKNSMALYRASRRDANSMPPFGSALVDEKGILLLNEWVKNLSCP